MIQFQSADECCQCRKRRGERRSHPKKRLFVELQIFVIRQRNPFHDREESRQLSDGPAGVTTNQLEDIGIFFLRHARRSGCQRIGKLGIARLVRREKNQIFRESRKMRKKQRGAEEIFGGEVAIGNGIDGIPSRSSKAERLRKRVAVDGQRRSGKRA